MIVEIVQTQKSQGSTIGVKNHKVLLLNTEEFNLTKLGDKEGGLLRWSATHPISAPPPSIFAIATMEAPPSKDPQD